MGGDSALAEVKTGGEHSILHLILGGHVFRALTIAVLYYECEYNENGNYIGSWRFHDRPPPASTLAYRLSSVKI